MEWDLVIGGKKFREELKRIAGASEFLEVGFFPVSVYSNGLPVAQVAEWQEFGTYNIPVRAFFRTTMHNNEKVYGVFLAQCLKKNNYNIDLSFEELGNKVKYDVQDSIEYWDTPPNAPITINGGWMKNKKSGKAFYVEGKGFDNPLVWTNTLQDAVRWKYKDESA